MKGETMRNIVLSVVVVAALVTAGIGGTLADFNDYEVSEDNYFQMGSMDLTVSTGWDDTNQVLLEYNGETVPALVTITTGWPDCSKDIPFDVHNAGEHEQSPPRLYLHFKNLECTWLPAKISVTTPYAYLSVDANDEIERPLVRHAGDDGNDIGINEPQDVAIFGGVAGEDNNGDPVTVPGIGDDAYCLLSRTLVVSGLSYSNEYDNDNPLRKSYDEALNAGEVTFVDLDDYDSVYGNDDGVVTLDELECNQILITTLTGCKMRWMNLSLRAVDIPESYFNDAVGDPMNYFGTGDESKWENWPTNATQNQKLIFDIGFELFGQQTPPP
jgi:predicted ribosomally synthesized peptide with SipW-like signal peptide